MVRGPQGIFAKVPGLDAGYRMLTRVLPLGRAPVTERDGVLYINPGSAGPRRFNLPITIARLDLGQTPWKVDFIHLSGAGSTRRRQSALARRRLGARQNSSTSIKD